MILSLNERELNLVIDALVHRTEDLTDLMPFTINPLAIKIRVKELELLLNSARNAKKENYAKAK